MVARKPMVAFYTGSQASAFRRASLWKTFGIAWGRSAPTTGMLSSISGPPGRRTGACIPISVRHIRSSIGWNWRSPASSQTVGICSNIDGRPPVSIEGPAPRSKPPASKRQPTVIVPVQPWSRAVSQDRTSQADLREIFAHGLCSWPGTRAQKRSQYLFVPAMPYPSKRVSRYQP